MEERTCNNFIETEIAIKYIKDKFEFELAKKLSLIRVSAPLIVSKESGLNDDLNGYERPVSFDVPSLNKNVEIVQSLAKWKRYALKKYQFPLHQGLYTDMNAIRRDERLDELHSLYVDQWDWEKTISKEERNLETLKSVVRDIYSIMKKIENLLNKRYPHLSKKLPDNISIISSDTLLRKYPHSSMQEREYNIVKEYKAVFIYRIGWPLKNGKPHDTRAADYDDWNLNGDILVYDSKYDRVIELSSMGIRVDENSLIDQLKYKKEYYKLNIPYIQDIISKKLPYTIGGGIGQSRLCLFYLEKEHIGEVQSSLWNDDYLEKKNIEKNKLL